MRDVMGFVSGALMVLSSAAHSFVGWPTLRTELGKTNAPPELVTGLTLGWHFAGAAMLTIGVVVLLQFREVRRTPSASLRPSQFVALVYLAFGSGALALVRDPFLFVFIVPGLLLAAASWGRR